MAYPSPVLAPEHAALLGHRIDKSRLKFVSVLGLGAYGVVYLAQDVSAEIGMSSDQDPSSPYSGRGYYAVKCLNKTGLDQRQKSFQRREIALHTLASQHDNIVSMHRVVETSSIIYVILAFCPDGDLFSMITEQSRYLGDDELIRSVFLQIVDAIDYCHRLGIYHRDLKPENILCCDGGKRVLLADFGLATTEKTSADFGCGSTFYMSPECQGGIHHRVPSYSTLHNDVWSLGVILVNLTCGRNPWKQATPSDETFRAYLDNRDFLRSILPISLECNDLLKRIFAIDPADRISIAEIRHRVVRMRRWTMTPDELSHATKATREAARGFPAKQPHQSPHPADAVSCDAEEVDMEQEPMPDSQPIYIDSFSSSDSSGFSSSDDASSSSCDDVPTSAHGIRPLPFPHQSYAAGQANSKVSAHSRLSPGKHQHHHHHRAVLQDSSNMDIDAEDNSSDSARTPVLGSGYGTPRTPQQKRTAVFGGSRRALNRRTPASSPTSQIPPTPSSARSAHSSASSSSSSNESWSDLPPTPDTPTFLRQMQNKSRPEVDMASAVERMETLASSTSSKASYELHYGDYSSWAEGNPNGLHLPPFPSPPVGGRRCDAKHSLAQLLESPMPPRRALKA